jgi:hypothetical protein
MTGRDHLEDLGIDERIILKLIKETDMRVWTGFNWLMIGPSVGLLWA